MLPASREARPSPSPQPLAAASFPHAFLFLTFATIACISLGRSAAYLSAAAGVEHCQLIAMERETHVVNLRAGRKQLETGMHKQQSSKEGRERQEVPINGRGKALGEIA